MKTLQLLGVLIICSVIIYCSKNEPNLIPIPDKKDELARAAVPDTTEIDSCGCQIKFTNLHKCNDCSFPGYWLLFHQRGSSNVRSWSSSSILWNTWYPILIGKNTTDFLRFCPGYNQQLKGEVHLDLSIRCPLDTGNTHGWQERKMRMVAFQGKLHCDTTSTSQCINRQIKCDSLCKLVIPASDDLMTANPCGN